MRGGWLFVIFIFCFIGAMGAYVLRKGDMHSELSYLAKLKKQWSGMAAPSAKSTSSEKSASTTEESKKHLAPPGYYCLLERVSISNDSGVIAFAAGSKLALLSRDKGKMRLTDGHTDVVVDESIVTNDLDIADMARKNDAASQRQINAILSQQKALADRNESEASERLRKRQEQLDQIAASRPAVVAQPTQSPLDRGAYDQHSSYYYYHYYSGPYYDRWGNRYYLNGYGNHVYY